MVHHIVMWKFKPEVEDAKKPELKKAMAENLKSLVGKVPGLLTVDFVEAPLASSTHDMALVTTLEKAEDVAVYAKHPEHIKEQSLIQKQPSKSEGCFCIYARKAHNIRLSGLFLFSGDLVD